MMMWQFEEDLTQRPNVVITTSEPNPSGNGARSPRVLLSIHLADEERNLPSFFDREKHTYDTFTGRHKAIERDWYALEFPETVAFNTLEMTMGLPNRDGGWWASLSIEIRQENTLPWQVVDRIAIDPVYDFRNQRGNRLPYETFTITFDEQRATAVRLIGAPGGQAQFTSLSRLAVFHRSLSRWNVTQRPKRPEPDLFRLVSPETLWDLSENFVALTGLPLESPFIESYLDEERFDRFWERIRSTYFGAPDLWQFMGDRLGWNTWHTLLAETSGIRPDNALEPHVSIAFHGLLAQAVAPIAVEGLVVGELATRWVIPADKRRDRRRLRRYAAQYGVPWKEFAAAVKNTRSMTLEQLQGGAALLGMPLNVVANLTHHNLRYREELASQAGKTVYAQKTEIIRQAIEFMQSNLENMIGVADVARAVALSPAYFCTLFTEETGRNPREFLADLRIARAKEYLTHSSMSISEICALLGYTPSHFSRLFKHQTGLTPRQYAGRFHHST